MSQTQEQIDKIKQEWLGMYLCEECHRELVTMMNIGLAKRGKCERCGATRHPIYEVEE